MDEFFELVTNQAHWGFEIVTDLVKAPFYWLLAAVIPERVNPFKRWVKRHDREEHNA